MVKTCSACYFYCSDSVVCESCDENFSNHRPKQSEVEHEYDLACDEISELKLEILGLKNKFKTMFDFMSDQIEWFKADNGLWRKLYADAAMKIIKLYEEQAKWETF